MLNNSANLTVIYFIKYLEKLNFPNTLWVYVGRNTGYAFHWEVKWPQWKTKND
jgi:hypothetical protein